MQTGKNRKRMKLLAQPKQAYDKCQHVVDIIMSKDIAWPCLSRCSLVCDFATALVECVHAALDIGPEDEVAAYSGLGIARKIIYYLCERMPDATDNIDMGTILRWTADEGGHGNVLKSWSGRQVRMTFGLQPIMVTCWTCYLNCCNAAALKALQEASDKRLIEILAELNAEGNHAPGPHTVAKVLLDGRSCLKNLLSPES